MQVLLTAENKTFKEKIKLLVRNFISKDQVLNLKELWQHLHKNSFISKDNSFLRNVLLVEAMSKAEPGLGLFLLTQFTCIEIINSYANEKLKNKYLGKLISGEYIGSFALTEPNAGSDISMIETNAKKENTNWILNGHKIWSSNGSISDIIITFAQTKPHKDKSGITCFLVPSHTKEIKILKKETQSTIDLSKGVVIL